MEDLPRTVKPRSQPTLQDVARAAGLSPATISLALNRRPEECTLTDATRRRAIAAARKLGYRPNFRARALASRRNFTVGFVFAREAPILSGVNEHIVVALTDALHQHNYHQLMVPLIGDPARWSEVIRPDRLDGCIMLSPLPEQLEQLQAETGLPMVAINERADLPISVVAPDEQMGTKLLMDHLLQLGHRDIVYVHAAANVHYSVQQRADGYAAAMRAAGLGDRIRIASHATAAEFVDRYLQEPHKPTAIVAYDHILAIGLLHDLAARGVRVPQDVSVATFNDVFPVAMTIPPLTTVAVPAAAMGRAAAELLVQLINKSKGKAPSSVEHPHTQLLPETLVVRRSTAAPRRG
jgi:LacI family transcriptional regulator